MSKKQNKSDDLVISSAHEGRIDKFLVSQFPDHSRSFLQRLINNRNVKLDGHPVSSNHRLQSGQTIHIDWPSADPRPPIISSGPLPFPVVFEDKYFMVINKPAGLLVHPAGWKRDGSTLVEILYPKLRSTEWPDKVRPGLVHRLDRDTSGLLVFAKTPEAHTKISKQFANRQVKKTYQALVLGKLSAKEGSFECGIGRHPEKKQRFAVTETGRWSVTKFKVKEVYGDVASRVELYPLTGRTHQLRVQLSGYHHPILGDHVYGGMHRDFPTVTRQMLHASNLKFTHPETHKPVEFSARPPSDFQDAIKLIRSSL